MSIDPALGASEPPAARERLPRPFGKFALKRKLARGGMADVYLASLSGAEGFEKELVVKLIRQELAADEAFVRRFVDEAKTSVRLTHPNIVSIFELGVETGVLYLAMDLVRGATLAEVLQDGGPLKPEEGAYVALEVARALHHAHRRGVIHRDVTPGNVMLDDEGAVKLLDFGIAAPARSGAEGDRVWTAADVEVFGTPGHMPPEQIEGRALTGAADVFALGTVMLEAWTGRAPFRRADARASATALHETPPAASTVHAGLAPLDDVVASMLTLDASKRPQHADDVARVLRAWLRERNVDLDEVARGLAQRVKRAVTAREDREAGRATAAAPMQKALRPTPLGDASRTFATRGSIDTWSGPSTRKVDGDETGEREEEAPSSLPSQPSATRRIESEKSGDVSEPTAARSRSWISLAIVAALGIGAVAIWMQRGNGQDLPKNSTTTSSTAPSPTPSPSPSPATTPTPTPIESTSSTAPMPTTSVSSSATASGSAAVTSARLVVTSSPPSLVELDGRSLGKTPISTTAPLGDHRLVLRPTGLGESFERRITLSATQGMDVHGDFNDEPQITLRRIPATAK